MITLAKISRNVVVPWGPTTENMLLAREAPDWIDAMAMSSSPTENRVEARLRGWSFITWHRPKYRNQGVSICVGQYTAHSLQARLYISSVFAHVDRKPKSVLDGRFQISIIRPTSGAVETENSLVNKELRSFRQQVASVHRSRKGVEKEVLTAACNAVEFASR
ncbi:hypothetical protein D3C80_1366750 [compost metagenome]